MLFCYLKINFPSWKYFCVTKKYYSSSFPCFISGYLINSKVDCVRAEDAYTARSTEEHIPGQTREWNEELQAVRELPGK